MSGPVDVLAVMDKCHSSLECGGLRHSLSEASAAMAEMIEESRLLLAGVDRVNGLTVVQTHDLVNFKAALARVQGVAA